MKTIKFARDPYDMGFPMFSKEHLDLEENHVYILCGCNGYGKSTLMRCIMEEIRYPDGTDLNDVYHNPFMALYTQKEKELEKPYILLTFDKGNRSGHTEESYLRGAMRDFTSSNGEGIIDRFGDNLVAFKKWLADPSCPKEDKTAFFFFDDVDAGTSIDMLLDVKAVIGYMAADCRKAGVFYIFIVPSNAFEMTFGDAPGWTCLDAITLKELHFKDYEDYRTYVQKTRKAKDKRNSKI